MLSLVTVAIVSRGNNKNLKRAIDGVMSQTYGNTELIVVNYGPRNNQINSIIQSYGDSLKFFTHSSSDMAESLNFALKEAKGDYFTWISENDFQDPSIIKRQIDEISDKEKTIAVSGWISVNANNRTLKILPADRKIENYPGCSLGFDCERVNTCAMLFPVNIFKNGIQFNKNRHPARDYEMLEKMVGGGVRFKVVDHQLLRYSSHSEAIYIRDSMITNDNDYVQSNIISNLAYQEIIGYFKSEGDAVKYYLYALTSGRPRVAAFLLQGLITGLINSGDQESARRLLLETLSGLPDEKMATKADEVISMINKPSSKKKLLFSSAQWLTGGMERVMSVLFRELADDYEIYLITPYDERESHIGTPSYVVHLKIEEQNFKKYFDVMILTYALLLDIDVVIGYMNLFEKQLNLYNLCVGTKIKTIASNHEYYFYPYKSPTHYDVVEKRLNAFKNCDAIVWPNNFSAALCGIYVESNYVIGNPNNFAISEKISKKPKENIILGVGRFDDYVKRIDRILACFSQVLREVPDARLVLVGKYDNNAPYGPGGGQTVNNLINELGIPLSNINFVGEVDNVDDYYKSAKVLILTSNSEGFGMVLTESACFGVPAVCNYFPGVEDIVSDGWNGYVVEQGNIDNMSKKIISILKDNKLRLVLGANAKHDVKMFDSRHIGDKWRHLINKLIEDKDAHSSSSRSCLEGLEYSISSKADLTMVLSQEINDTINVFIQNRNEQSQYSRAKVISNKIRMLPKRLKNNIEFEGLGKTVIKVAVRTRLLIHKGLKGHKKKN